MAFHFPTAGKPMFGKPLTVKKIVEVEAELKVSFPDDYKRFLLSTNGRRFVPDLFCFEMAPDRRGRVDELYGIGSPKSRRDIREAQTDYEFSDRVPKKFISIGAAPGWARIVLDTETFRIKHWDTGTPFEPKGTNVHTEMWLTDVAVSFTAFVKMLDTFED